MLELGLGLHEAVLSFAVSLSTESKLLKTFSMLHFLSFLWVSYTFSILER